MKLASIINVWDGVELLPYAIASTSYCVDLYVIVYQTTSNFGEYFDPLPEIMEIIKMFANKRFEWYHYEPLEKSGAKNETEKRNIGIRIANRLECTHFFFQDVDECYENFPACVEAYNLAGKEGSVCKIYTYFKLPTLRFERPDSYFAPFIHVLKPDSVAGTPNYPFYVDPTRSCNCSEVAELPIFMHHFSYIRRDIGRKLRNSSARENIKRSTVLADWTNAAPGYHVKPFFDQKLIEVPNLFGIEI